jgi:tetratricopeptide (TPR) repeat protein/predicted Ser/Thr protein kinase
MKAGFGTASGTEGGADPGFVPPTVKALAKLFPQLEVLEFIGKGGMGAVYKARQPGLDRLVALKILPPRAGDDPGFAERFTREARALARLTHPNIVAVYDFGQAGATPEAAQPASRLHYFLMEYVEGPNLRQLERAGRLSPRDAMRIIPQICEALQYAHDEGIVHRDIKPENVLLDKKGRVKIADFGLAKILGREPQNFRLTSAGQIMGTPHYMAPEQVEDPQAVDHRADIYSLGVVFYEMITGELPLGKFAPPSCKVQMDVRLDEVVLHALEKEPGRRYQHASQVKTDVETIANSSASQPPTQPAKGRMSTDTRKGLLYGLGAAAACLVIGLPIWFLAAHGGGNAGQLSQDGWQLWQARRWDEAAAKFHQAIKADPKEANAWNGLGWASFNAGKLPEAAEAFERCLALDSNAAGAWNGLGQLYLGQKKYDLAETYLLKASPDAPAAWYGLARLYLLQGKYDKAEEWAGKLIDSGQGDEGAKQMLETARSKQASKGKQLIRWLTGGSHPEDYKMAVDPTITHGGQGSAHIESIVPKPGGFATMMQNLKADAYRGKRLRMTGYVRSQDVKGWASPWMRIDGAHQEPLDLDSMQTFPIKGTSDWQKLEIAMYVPESAQNIAFGLTLTGAGQVWMGDLDFAVVGKDVPTTGLKPNEGASPAPVNPGSEQ